MAAPPHYTQRVGGDAPMEDCRDFLRTGRCKYGASCKYNHPPNVQIGGGIKMPIDPSEPLFPVRPNEPNCQYYMKHGTCKFGQACKFHHPPQSAVTTALLSGNAVVMNDAVVMNVGRGGEVASQQMLLNSLGGDPTATPGMTLQFLPQRPGEPDCIYFLRNGRCKYGATCRYHHPVTVHQRKRANSQGSLSTRQPQPTQLVSQQPITADDRSRRQRPTPANYSQVAQQRSRAPPKGPPVHYVVADGQFAVVTVNNPASGTPQYRQVGNGGVAEGTEYYVTTGAPSTPSMRQESSSSSVSSSYETASSGFEYISQTGDPNATGVWVRTRVGSGGSLNTLSENESTQAHPAVMYRSGGRVALTTNSSDNNLVGRNRGESFGSSASDNSARVHPDSSWNAAGSGHPSGVRIWPDSGHHVAHHSTMRSHASPSSGRTDSHSRQPNEQHHATADEGLSMMTSALLNMLDTPEDAASKSYSQIHADPTSPPSTPGYGPVQGPSGDQAPPSPSSFQGERPTGRMAANSRYTFTSSERPRGRATGPVGSIRPPSLPFQADPAPRDSVHVQTREWSPVWPTPSQAQQLEQGTQAMSVLQHPPDGNTHHTSSNVGLYLP